MTDHSERVDGPSLIVIAGDASADNEYRLGTREYDWHAHHRGQLLCVETGLIHVQAEEGTWLLPPHRAGWIPPGVRHQVRVTGALSGWTIFVAPAACASLPVAPCVIGISEVLAVLAHRAASWEKARSLAADEKHIAQVICDEIGRAPHESLNLPMPRDARLLRVAHAILEEPGRERVLDEWAALATMSERSLRRAMRAETGLGFAQWRQQAQLLHALDRLAQGDAVAVVADAMGYASPSNFIAMFRKALGVTPGQLAARAPTSPASPRSVHPSRPTDR
ncbi:helix-turn-helix transcriptional regulator [Luteibacter anthropi]|uniref:AraC family transcriptional regulator n=1 Tax=Luteibacter anthropi TaxID=564369 RepID=UPI002032C543|nr:helix-turn-helix transcriptional regulator [Luteibacter anthropi]URX63632.1 helix-turn-helix transcriptional regulator [Luteibacter anthropi]